MLKPDSDQDSDPEHVLHQGDSDDNDQFFDRTGINQKPADKLLSHADLKAELNQLISERNRLMVEIKKSQSADCESGNEELDELDAFMHQNQKGIQKQTLDKMQTELNEVLKRTEKVQELLALC